MRYCFVKRKVYIIQIVNKTNNTNRTTSSGLNGTTGTTSSNSYYSTSSNNKAVDETVILPQGDSEENQEYQTKKKSGINKMVIAIPVTVSLICIIAVVILVNHMNNADDICGNRRR